MTPLPASTSTWVRALTLSERCATRAGDETPRLTARLTARATAGRGAARLQRWRSQPPFDLDDYFARRLALDGIDAARLEQLLDEPSEELQARLAHLPAWIAELLEAYAQPAEAYADPLPGEEILGFLNLVQPLVDIACARLRDGIDACIAAWPALPFDPATVEDVLLANLPDPLLMRLSRTLVLELNIARLKGELEGETAEARFQSFVTRLRDPAAALAILAEYPVLAQQLSLYLRQWAGVMLEFLERLCADWPAIRAHFSPDADPGVLVDLAGGAGDTHRGGRSVMVAEFESGFRVVYKPKSLAVDLHMQELFRWANARGCAPSLGTLHMLDCGAHGWAEFVPQLACHSHAEVTDFYRRLGAYLAVLYATNATDFHLENVIASGPHPMLIDLETIFHPQFWETDGADADAAADRVFANSVLQVGLLPQRIWSGADYTGIDISGLGGAPGQLSPDRVPQPAGAGTDAMRFVRERVELPGDANRPMLDGVEVRALDHVEDFVAGFCGLYALICRHRAELTAADGLLSRFDDDEIRVLLRATRTYSQLLFESFHPDLLHDALARDQFLDRLWIAAPSRTYLAPVIRAEQADLRQGDIPLFTTRPASRDLWSADGTRFPDHLSQTGRALAEKRLAQMDERDLQRQAWLIRASLASLISGRDRPSALRAAPDAARHAAAHGASQARLHACARAAADRLVASAILGQDDATWLGLGPTGVEEWEITTLGLDLYGGVPGITLFLAYAGELLQEARYTELARRGLRTVLRHAELLRTTMRTVGGFDGWGGVLYTFTHLGVLWQDPDLLAQAEETVELIAEYATEDNVYTVARGAAGAVAALAAFHRCVPSPRTRTVAVVCGEHLLASATPQPQGLAWTMPGTEDAPLTGFAHGAAGIAWALLELTALTGNDRYLRTAQQALTYERSLFAPEQADWPDLRPPAPGAAAPDAAAPSATPQRMTAWCHGATGIGLARLRVLRHLDDPHLAGEIDAALHTVRAQAFARSHCLCHGDMGALDFLLEAERTLGDRAREFTCARFAAATLDSIERDGWLCGGPNAVETPDLMLGLAGIGYQALRLAAPEQVPSVLLLDPPPAVPVKPPVV